MKKIKIGADPFPPYQYKQPNGSIAGSDYDRVVSILRKAGYEPEVTVDEWSVVFKAIENDAIDALFQVQDTPERLEKYFFSDLLRYAVTELITTDENLIGLDQYSQIPEQGLKLGVLDGFANGADIDALPESCKQYYPDTQSLLKAETAGETDLAVCDRGVRNYLSEKMGIEPCFIVEALTFQRALYVMFRKEADRDAFNAAMEREQEDR